MDAEKQWCGENVGQELTYCRAGMKNNAELCGDKQTGIRLAMTTGYDDWLCRL